MYGTNSPVLKSTKGSQKRLVLRCVIPQPRENLIEGFRVPTFPTSFAADVLRREGEVRVPEAAPRRRGDRVRGPAPRLRRPGMGGHETKWVSFKM